MTTMVAEVYDALVSAGASDEKARAAASAIAGYDHSDLKADVNDLKADVRTLKGDVAGLKTDMTLVKADVALVKSDIAGIRQELTSIKTNIEKLAVDGAVLKWAVGLIVAALASLVIKAYF